jgi:hypothetical protein
MSATSGKQKPQGWRWRWGRGRVPAPIRVLARRSEGESMSPAMTYLTTLPVVLPDDGRVLVHNSVRPTPRLGSRGFRAWLQPRSNALEPCACGWAPELGPHYRVIALVL